MILDFILKELENRKKAKELISLKNTYKKSNGSPTSGRVSEAKVKTYALGDKYKGIYFTFREAQCAVDLLRGKSMVQVARILKLSPRTIEFYTNNMKKKLNCRTKSELIGKIFDSELMKNVDFITTDNANSQ